VSLLKKIKDSPSQRLRCISYAIFLQKSTLPQRFKNAYYFHHKQHKENTMTASPKTPKLAPRMSAVQPSPIIEVSNAVRDLKAKGEKVISFSIGVPGFLPPAHVYAAAEEAASQNKDSGAYLAGRGQNDLITAFLDRLNKDGLTYTEAETCVQLGGKGALFNLFQILVEAGDEVGSEVLCPAPYWASYPDMVALAGADFRAIACPAAQNYKMTPEQLDAAITPKTKVFIFNNPSNPTGMLYTPEEVDALAAVLLNHPHLTIISDDIYDKLTYGAPFKHVTTSKPTLKPRTIIVQSVSKTYGMPGWRIGMVAAPEHIVKALLTVTSQSFTNMPAVTQAAGAAAFGGDHSFLEAVKTDFITKRDLVLTELAKLDGITCPKPEGAFYVFPNISAYFGKSHNGTPINTDVDFCKALLAAEKVACVPGSGFGDPEALRISYATDEATLRDGLMRFTNFVNALK